MSKNSYKKTGALGRDGSIHGHRWEPTASYLNATSQLPDGYMGERLYRDGTKSGQRLEKTGQRWEKTGRRWEAIFNTKELLRITDYEELAR